MTSRAVGLPKATLAVSWERQRRPATVDERVNAAAVVDNQDSSLHAGCDKGELSGVKRVRSQELVTE